ncbi:hypothetical protein ACROYT_G031877 [Oculina patagonica]
MVIIHVIDENSPFYDVTPQTLQESEFEIVVVLDGVVEATGLNTQPRSSYLNSEILWGYDFCNTLEKSQFSENGFFNADFSRFNDLHGCKGHLIDSIINFRDNLEEEIFSTAQEHAARCDLMLCLGTTMTVSPANELVEMGKQPLRIVVCNRQKTDVDKLCVTQDARGKQLGSRVFGDCDNLMSQVMRHLMSHDALQEWEKERTVRMREYDQRRTKS